jgi:environmental stress-induced protein Ves
VIIRASSLTKSLWKNRGGTTTEIARSGVDSTTPASPVPFDWRLSFADVNSSCAFSEFPGCDRWLVVWNGHGLHLGSKMLLPFEPFHFDGGVALDAAPTRGSIIDLGLIYKRDKFSATMSVIDASGLSEPSADFNFIFVVSGELNVNSDILRSRDTVQWSRHESLKISSADFRAILVSIDRLRIDSSR